MLEVDVSPWLRPDAPTSPGRLFCHTYGRGHGQALDGALQTILAQPFGRFMLTAVALGFLAFGLFAILQARYRPM